MPSRTPHPSRRDLLAASGLAALAAGLPPAAAFAARDGAKPQPGPRAPFDSLRDYVAALDAHRLLVRIPRIDQDAYQSTALMFYANERFGFTGSPAFLFENVRIDGKWMRGPVLANHLANYDADCIVFGLDPVPGDPYATYRRAKTYLTKMLLANDGSYPLVPPVEVARERAPCKEVTLTGDDIDLLGFPFMQTNPADAGRYLNTGSVFTSDAKLGNNFGTYRCQIVGPRTLLVNSAKMHVGYKTWMAARERGETVARVSIAQGNDPYVYTLSGSPIARRRDEPVDELAMAGGLRGKALEVVKSDTSDLLVPAHAEMVIEGEVPLQAPLVTEGPFGEMFGYLGPQTQAVFTLNVTRVTHRKQPWILNSYTGMHRGYVTSPIEALYDQLMKGMVPNLLEFHYPQDMMGVAFISIDKTGPGQGLEAGRKIAMRIPIVKVIVVVDKDMDVLDRTQMLFAIGSRWQPYPAAEIIKDAPGIITDPSAPETGRSSKIVIDATRQWPEEGGPQLYAQTNRALLDAGAPAAMDAARDAYGELLTEWQLQRLSAQLG